MNLGNTVLSERGQSQKTMYPLIPFIGHVQKGTDLERQKVDCGCLGLVIGGQMGSGCPVGLGFLFGMMKMF